MSAETPAFSMARNIRKKMSKKDHEGIAGSASKVASAIREKMAHGGMCYAEGGVVDTKQADMMEAMSEDNDKLFVADQPEDAEMIKKNRLKAIFDRFSYVK